MNEVHGWDFDVMIFLSKQYDGMMVVHSVMNLQSSLQYKYVLFDLFFVFGSFPSTVLSKELQ